MPREKTTPEQRERRQRAFALFCTTDPSGKRPQYREIALKTGVTLNTVHYWRRHDKWEENLAKQLDIVGGIILEQKQTLKQQLRTGAQEAVASLRSILIDKQTPTDDRIKAASALVKIAKDSGAIDLDLLADEPLAARELQKFDDALPPQGEESPCSELTTSTLDPSLTSSEPEPMQPEPRPDSLTPEPSPPPPDLT